MKINSTGTFPMSTSRLFMYLDTTRPMGLLPSELQEITIISTLKEVDSSRGYSLIIVDLPVHTAIKAAKRKAMLDSSSCELWVQRSNPAALEKLISAGNELAIAGINLKKEWVQFRVQSAAVTDRDAGDLLWGLRIPRLVAATPRLESVESVTIVPRQTEGRLERLMDKAISVMVPPAKAIRPYLPSRVVGALYKILDKIR